MDVSRWIGVSMVTNGNWKSKKYLNEEDVCPCFCECESHCLSDSPGPTRHESGLTLEGEELLHRRHLSLFY